VKVIALTSMKTKLSGLQGKSGADAMLAKKDVRAEILSGRTVMDAIGSLGRFERRGNPGDTAGWEGTSGPSICVESSVHR
jgi:hypothetical protein